MLQCLTTISTLERDRGCNAAHIKKENDNRNMAEECRTIAREQKEKMQAQFTKGKGEKRHILLRLGRYLWQFKGWLFLAILLSISSNLLSLAGLCTQVMPSMRWSARDR